MICTNLCVLSGWTHKLDDNGQIDYSHALLVREFVTDKFIHQTIHAHRLISNEQFANLLIKTLGGSGVEVCR